MARGYVLDTNVLIEAMRSPAAAVRLADWQRRMAPFIWQHSVVTAELLAGARGEAAWRRWKEAWITPSERIGRVVTPSHGTWLRASRIIARLAGDGVVSSRGFLNDCLIAASAQEHGFTVVTWNAADFGRIAGVQPELVYCGPLP
jgi:predicted nucleic acid-binding protein